MSREVEGDQGFLECQSDGVERVRILCATVHQGESRVAGTPEKCADGATGFHFKASTFHGWDRDIEVPFRDVLVEKGELVIGNSRHHRIVRHGW